MLTLSQLRERATDTRELMRAWCIACDGIHFESEPNRVKATLVSSDKKETYDVWISDIGTGCECVSFGRSRKRAFCKHVAALALSWIGQGRVDSIPGLADIDPVLAAKVASLDAAQMRSILIFAAAMSGEVYKSIMG